MSSATPPTMPADAAWLWPRPGDEEEDERLQRAERRLPQGVGDEVGAHLRVVADDAAERERLLHHALGVRAARVSSAPPGAGQRDPEEAPHRDREQDRRARERRLGPPGDEQAAADERDAGADPAPDRLRGLRAGRDRVVDEIGVQRAVGLVRDEVGDEEHRHRDHNERERLDQAGDREADAGDRGRRDEEGQPAADRGAQSVRPAADDQRQPQREDALDGDETADDDRRVDNLGGPPLPSECDREDRGHREQQRQAADEHLPAVLGGEADRYGVERDRQHRERDDPCD
jgi:hypothetical protein